jgi:hypothetical protein
LPDAGTAMKKARRRGVSPDKTLRERQVVREEGEEEENERRNGTYLDSAVGCHSALLKHMQTTRIPLGA